MPDAPHTHEQVDSPAFYDRHWEHTDTAVDPYVVEKGDRILRLMPDGVRSVLDVGCGDGYLTHRIAERFDVTAADRSGVALSRLRCPTVEASADALPLGDRSFDMVFASELLEHLPAPVLAGAAREFDRVARAYVFVAVPHRENLRRRFARCPGCQLEFHIDCHHHSFDKDALARLFPRFRCVASAELGAFERATQPALERIRQRIGRRWWVWDGAKITCPRCGHDRFESPPRSLVHRAVAGAVDVATALVNARSGRSGGPYWLLALFRRTNE
jgi:SAM-dependent methyltransferase